MTNWDPWFHILMSRWTVESDLNTASQTSTTKLSGTKQLAVTAAIVPLKPGEPRWYPSPARIQDHVYPTSTAC
jgi:hypothetical protein